MPISVAVYLSYTDVGDEPPYFTTYDDADAFARLYRNGSGQQVTLIRFHRPLPADDSFVLDIDLACITDAWHSLTEQEGNQICEESMAYIMNSGTA